MALSKQVEVQRKDAPHNCCSENNPQRKTTMTSFVAAAVLYIWVYFADSFSIIPSFISPFRCSPSVLPTKCMSGVLLISSKGASLCVCCCQCCCRAMWVCTYVCVGDLTGVVVAAVWALSGLQSTAENSVPQGAGPDRAEGARGRRGSSSTYPPGWRTGCQAAAAA